MKHDTALKQRKLRGVSPRNESVINVVTLAARYRYESSDNRNERQKEKGKEVNDD